MPDHTSWFSYLLTLPGLRSLETALDQTGLNRSMSHTSESILNHPHTPVTLEYSLLAVFSILVILLFAVITKGRVAQTEKAILPEGELTVSSFTENFVNVFYGLLNDALGPKDAKHFLPIIGTCAIFIFFSNAMGLLPGFAPPTSNFNVTFACGLVVFFTTHLYGLKRGGVAYLKHFLGPVLALSWLLLPLEIISHIARPITLAIRLMVNMFVDHLVVSVFTVLVALVLPVPIMVMGVLVVTVQTYVFCLLSTVYIQMAIEHHDDHGAEGGHAHHDEHAPAAAHAA
jgi:F-type H+-transporting ATPase subunit a